MTRVEAKVLPHPMSRRLVSQQVDYKLPPIAASDACTVLSGAFGGVCAQDASSRKAQQRPGRYRYMAPPEECEFSIAELSYPP